MQVPRVVVSCAMPIDDPRRVHYLDTLGALGRDLAHPIATLYKELVVLKVDPIVAQAIAIAFLDYLLARLAPKVSNDR